MDVRYRLPLGLGATALAPAIDPQEFRKRGAGEEVIYFLLPDRFANGDAGNDRGGLARRAAAHRVRSTRQGVLSRR